MSKIFMPPETLLKILTEQRSKGLKVIYVGMGKNSLDTFYVRSIPTANMIDINEITETSPNL
jgi:hypothetical protein